jgi:peptidoglycan/xylan/chitin deacetylase (PgdA/CDA1 family)
MRFFSRVKSLPRASVRRARRRRARRRAGSRRVILLYHRVAALEHDPFELAVSPSLFHDHLEILKSRSRVVSLDEILQARATGSAVLTAVTFDDGYADNLHAASPLLCAAEVPATFFVSTGSLGHPRGFWWDRLASAIARVEVPSAALDQLNGITPIGSLASREARTEAALTIAPHLQRMHPVARDQWMAELETSVPVDDGGEAEACAVLDEAGVRELGAQPLTQLGAHTHSHAMLSQLTREEQLAEITRSVTAIHEITGTRPRFMAYPYGAEEHYNSDSCLAAKDAGMSAAFVNHGGPFDPKNRPYVIPRHYVPALSPDAFRTRLRAVLGV